MQTVRKASALIASLLIVTLACGLLVEGFASVGIPLIVVGLLASIWQIKRLYAAREDPYDLKRLFDPPPSDDQPEDEYPEDGDVPLCHHCGHAVAKPFARCPECGTPVR